MDLTAGEAIGSRLARNLLPPGTGEVDPGKVVAALCSIQAQDLPSARLAIRARSTGLTDAGVEAARVQDRSFVRTWAMRGTLHLVPASDLAWIRRLLLPGVVRSSARRSAQLGLDEAVYRRAMELIRQDLSGGAARTRNQLQESLARRGIDLSGQRAAYVLLRASVEGLICEGPLAGGRPSYVLLDEWLTTAPAPPANREADLARLVSRYLQAYGPAGPEDLASWSGLKVSECRAAFSLCEANLMEVSVAGRTAWTTPVADEFQSTTPAPGGLRLLPAFDTFLLGYRHRGLHLAPRHARRVNAGGGMVRPVVLVDGRVEGSWRLVRRARKLEVVIQPFTAVPAKRRPELEDEVSDIGRYLQAPASLTIGPASGPLEPARLAREGG